MPADDPPSTNPRCRGDALDRRTLNVSLDELTTENLFRLNHDFDAELQLLCTEPSAARVQSLGASLPLLDRVVDLPAVARRTITFRRNLHREQILDLSRFAPELVSIQSALRKRIGAVPPGIAKAELALRPIAESARIDADLEASVYFASRGKPLRLNSITLSKAWREEIQEDLKQRAQRGTWPEEAARFLESGPRSLAELCRIGLPTPFLRGNQLRDHFIEATMFRAIEWFDVAGFEPWLDRPVSELSTAPEFGSIMTFETAWELFYWCRSNLALEMAEHIGLETWLRMVIVGGDGREEIPWRIYLRGSKRPGHPDYVPIAGIIAFAWHRIGPEKHPDTVLKSAVSLLLQSQLPSGGWPLVLGDREASVLSTCVALHGLCLDKPRGWEGIAAAGRDWLLSEQDWRGLWPADKDTHRTVLAVLALDAIELAAGGSRLTFGCSSTEPCNENPPYLFRREDDVWRIRFRGNPSTVKHRAGLAYIAELLRHRGEGLPALTLYYAVNGTPTGVSSLFAPREPPTEDTCSPGSEESRDSDAVERARAAALREQLKEAQEALDEEREEELLGELETIHDHLAQQEREHKLEPDPALEKARLSVRQNISRALTILARHDAALASFLTHAIKTGHSCSYQPTDPVPWEF